MRTLRIGMALGLVACGAAAMAQDTLTVGEILDKGGTKLGAEEVRALLSGATVVGIQRARPQTSFSSSYKADGTVTGFAANRITGRDNVALTGSWEVNADGATCSKLVNARGLVPAGTDACFYWLKVADQLYQAPTLARTEVANLRVVNR